MDLILYFAVDAVWGEQASNQQAPQQIGAGGEQTNTVIGRSQCGRVSRVSHLRLVI